MWGVLQLVGQPTIKGSNSAESEFSPEFGNEFKPPIGTISDWRPRVRKLEAFQVAATGDLQRQKQINNEFVNLGILQGEGELGELGKLT